jgi:hypothetical protein
MGSRVDETSCFRDYGLTGFNLYSPTADQLLELLRSKQPNYRPAAEAVEPPVCSGTSCI